MAGSWLPRQDVIVAGESLPTPDAIEFVDSDSVAWQSEYDEATGTARVSAASSSSTLPHLAWVVDSNSGDDTASGDAAHPLRTLAKLQELWAGKRTTGAATLSLLGNFATELLVLQATLGGALTISATPTPQYTGAVGAFQALAAPATDAQLTDAGIGSWAPHVKRRLRLTSGANAGALATVLKDLGGNIARVSQFVSPSTGLAVTPVAGDAYVIETLPTAVGNMHLLMLGSGVVTVKDLAVEPISGTSTYTIAGGGGSANCLIVGCESRGANSWSIGGGSYLTMRGCKTETQLFLGKNGIQGLSGHAAFANVNIQQLGSVRFSGGGSFWQAARLLVNLNGQADYNTDMVFLDVSTGAPVTVAEGSTFTGAGSANGKLWGVNNTGAFYGVQVNAGGHLLWATQPTVASGSGDVSVGGVVQTWAGIAALPRSHYVNPSNGASAGASSGSAGATSNAFWLSPVDQMSTGTAPAEAAGSFTTGISFQVTRTVTCTGVRFYKGGGTSRTFRCKLWNAAGAVLASVDVATTAAGVYVGTFATPQVLSQEAGSGAVYKVSIWEITNSFYSRCATGTPCILPPAATPFLASRAVIVKHLGAFFAGDANPTSEAAGERYPVEPVIID